MTFVCDASLPLPGMHDNTPTPPAFQMTLIGQPKPVRIPERLWRSWLDDPAVVSRFESKRYRRCCREQRWPGSAGCHRPVIVPSGRRICPNRLAAGPCRAHLLAYQLEYGAISSWAGPTPTMRCCAINVASPAAPIRHTCGWEPIAATAANTSSGDATSPAPSPTCEGPRVALVPSARRDSYRTTHKKRRHRIAHRCGPGCRTSALTLVAPTLDTDDLRSPWTYFVAVHRLSSIDDTI